MKGEAGQTRYSYPGREVDIETREPIYDSRMFFGACSNGRTDAAIWFEHFLGEDRKWHEDVFFVEVKDDTLVKRMMEPSVGAPKLAEAEDAVRKGLCQEVPGLNRSSEP